MTTAKHVPRARYGGLTRLRLRDRVRLLFGRGLVEVGVEVERPRSARPRVVGVGVRPARKERLR